MKKRAQTALVVEDRSIGDVIPYEQNPRVNNKQAIDAVVKSIDNFGFRQPIVVDASGVIICGHTRLLAAKKIGLKTVPVHVADLTEDQARAYRIADNRSSEFADWDDVMLKAEIEALDACEFDLSVLEFDHDELARLMGDVPVDADAAPEPMAEAISRPGAIYALGRHRLIVGDSTDAGVISRLVGDDQIDLLLTDPPYNVAYTGKTEDALTIKNDALEDGEFRAFLNAAYAAADSVMRPGAVFYIWHADSEGFNFRGACRDTGWQVRQCLIWVKNSMVMGRQDYHWQHEPCLQGCKPIHDPSHEPCLYGWKSGAAHLWNSDHKQTTLLEFDRPARSTDHPTMKPVALFEYQIMNSTLHEGRVLDPFGGSGTTVIAAECAGRTAYTCELDPCYADVIRRRWAEFVDGEGCEWESKTPEVEA